MPNLPELTIPPCLTEPVDDLLHQLIITEHNIQPGTCLLPRLRALTVDARFLAVMDALIDLIRSQMANGALSVEQFHNNGIYFLKRVHITTYDNVVDELDADKRQRFCKFAQDGLDIAITVKNVSVGWLRNTMR